MYTMTEQFLRARAVSTPLVAVRTADQSSAVFQLKALLEKTPLNPAPLVLMTWDMVRGVQPLSDEARRAFAAWKVDSMMTVNGTEALSLAREKLPTNGVLFLFNAHRAIDSAAFVQALWNLREAFKANLRMAVLLCPDIVLPTELQPDTLVIDEPLPTEAQLEALIKEQYAAAQIGAPKPEVLTRAVSAIAGLAMFPAEQVVAMSLKKSGVDLERLWERKRQAIEQTPGLSVWRGGETFDDIGGIENIKTFGRSILTGNAPPRAVVFIDEIEKAMGGAAGDTSGVSQDMLGTLLTDMQNKASTGIICVGPPGAAKSAFAKALGNTGGIPTIAFDLSGMKGSLVGESGRNLRTALKIVDAVAQGRALYVATCNSIAALPPELRRRFNFGTFFFDLPTKAEREVIWALYIKRFGLGLKERGRKTDPKPDDAGWTGAEIRMCCDIAWRLDVSLKAAAQYIVPVARSAREKIKQLREEASDRYISASEPGLYQYVPEEAESVPQGRVFALQALDN